MATHVGKSSTEHFEVEATGPGEEWEEPGREHRHGFELRAVPMAIKVLEIVDQGRENRTFPRICGFRIRRTDQSYCNSRYCQRIRWQEVAMETTNLGEGEDSSRFEDSLGRCVLITEGSAEFHMRQ